MKIERTTFEVDGCTEPCIEVTSSGSDYAMVRIHPCYHLIGNNTVYATEYCDGAFNSQDEYDFEFEELTRNQIMHIAREQSIHIR